MSKQKIISCVLILISIIMMFCGWIVSDDRNEIVGYVDEFFNIDDIEDELDDMADDIEDALDYADIDLGVSPRYVVDSVMDIVDIILDGAISPSEVAFKFNKMMKVVKKVDKLSKSDKKDLPYQLREFEESFKEAVAFVKIFRFIFILTILLHILFIVLHILDKRVLGITLIITQLLWWIVFGIVTLALNSDYDLVHLSFAPFLSFVCVIAAMIVWIKGRPAKVPAYMNNSQPYAGYQGNMGYANQTPAYNQPMQAKAFCVHCGAQINADARFCPSCGATR